MFILSSLGHREVCSLFSLWFMDEEWSRDSKAQPDCLAHSHQRNPQWRKEPVAKYSSSMQRSLVRWPTGPLQVREKPWLGPGEHLPAWEAPHSRGTEIPHPKPAPQPCSQITCHRITESQNHRITEW